AFTQSYGSHALDASVLTIPLVGFLPANDPRMVSTVRAIEKGLMREGFVRRYSTEENLDGLPGDESPFLACSFWLADNYALQGRQIEAVELFERLLSIRNHLGLLAEEYDPITGRHIGNFPQGFSHLALIYSAGVIENQGGQAPSTPTCCGWSSANDARPLPVHDGFALLGAHHRGAAGGRHRQRPVSTTVPARGLRILPFEKPVAKTGGKPAPTADTV